MITYYDLVNELENMENSERNEKFIYFLNNALIDLKSDRYFRFIDHFQDLLNNRMINSYNKALDRINSITNDETNKSIEFNEFKNEYNFLIKMIDNKLIKEEDKNKIRNDLNKLYNDLINNIKEIGMTDFILMEEKE